MKCIKCNVEMKKRIERGVVIDTCPKCHGSWVDPGEVEKLKSWKDFPIVDAYINLRLEEKKESMSPAPFGLCPVSGCESQLDQVVIGGVRVEKCLKCGGMFFDDKELKTSVGEKPSKVKTLLKRLSALLG